MSPKKSIEISFVTPGSRGFSVFAHFRKYPSETLVPHDKGDTSKMQLRIYLVDFMLTSTQALTLAGHEPGPQCRCSECARLKAVEDDWICKMGTFSGRHLNSRNEIKSKSRVNAQW